MANNFTSKEIAEVLFVNAKSVDNNRSRISKKLELEQVTNSLLTWAISHKEIITRF